MSGKPVRRCGTAASTFILLKNRSGCSTGNMAINSRPRDGRPATIQDGFFYQGIRSNAKWSTLNAEIPKGEATGNLEVRPQCHVLRIEHDAAGRVKGVVYADRDGVR